MSGRRFKTRSVGLVEAETFFCLASKMSDCTRFIFCSHQVNARKDFFFLLTLYQRIPQLGCSKLAFELKGQYLNNYKHHHHERQNRWKGLFIGHLIMKSTTQNLPKRQATWSLSEGSRGWRIQREKPIVLGLWSSYEDCSSASQQLGTLPSFCCLHSTFRVTAAMQ